MYCTALGWGLLLIVASFKCLWQSPEFCLQEVRMLFGILAIWCMLIIFHLYNFSCWLCPGSQSPSVLILKSSSLSWCNLLLWNPLLFGWIFFFFPLHKTFCSLCALKELCYHIICFSRSAEWGILQFISLYILEILTKACTHIYTRWMGQLLRQ